MTGRCVTGRATTDLRGLILFCHGSPDPLWGRPLEELRAQICELDPGLDVALAHLSFGPSLSDAVTTLHGRGCAQIHVIAAMISAGGRHVQEDMPDAVLKVAQGHPDCEIRWIPGALGAEPSVVRAMALAACDLVSDAQRRQDPPLSG